MPHIEWDSSHKEPIYMYSRYRYIAYYRTRGCSLVPHIEWDSSHKEHIYMYMCKSQCVAGKNQLMHVRANAEEVGRK